MKEVIYKNLNQSKKHIVHNVLYGIIPVLLLAAISTVCVLPVSSAYADGLDYTVQVRPSLNITLSSSTVSLLLNPSTTPFGKADLNVSVGTNNFSGYKLYINATDNKLVNNAYSNPTYITTLSSSTTESAFPANSWGYRISSLSSGNADDADTSIEDFTGNNFYPFTPSTTTSGTLINSSTTATNDSNVTLTFGSKVNYEKPSGLYSLDFNFKALPIVTTNNIQNLDPTLCTSDPTIVTDNRDGQAYTIARLPWKQFDEGGNLIAEGTNCWMLDNLRLDLTDPAVQARLTSQTTNASDEALGYLINGGGSSPYPAQGVSEEWPWTSDSESSYNLPYIAVSGDVSGGGTWNRDTVPSVKYGDASGKTGVFYNYCAATAGSYCYGEYATAGNAEYDVCPAGWRLASGGVDSTANEYLALCNAEKGSKCDDNEYDSRALLLVRNSLGISFAGRFQDSLLKRQNVAAYLWTNTPTVSYVATSFARYVFIDSDRIYSTNSDKRYQGFSVRCLLTEPQS